MEIPGSSIFAYRGELQGEKRYILANLDECETRGERGFNYNMEKILKDLLGYYKRVSLRGIKEPAAPLDL